MNDMYCKAKLAWGLAMPEPLKQLRNRDDDHVMDALRDVIYNVTSESWTTDARIAWTIMQGRDIQ